MSDVEATLAQQETSTGLEGKEAQEHGPGAPHADAMAQPIESGWELPAARIEPTALAEIVPRGGMTTTQAPRVDLCAAGHRGTVARVRTG